MMQKYKSQIIMLILLLFVLASSVTVFRIKEGQELLVTQNSGQNCMISFSEDGITVSDETMAAIDNHKVVIYKDGTYTVTGNCSNGQIVVNSMETEKVILNIEALDLTCMDSAPLYVENASAVDLYIKGDNFLTDGSSYNLANGETKPNACLYSKKDLTIRGDGTLTIKANYHNGISVRADFKMKSGTVTVDAANNALDSKDSISIQGGSLSLSARKDGIDAKNQEDTEKGTILISGGNINIQADDDGMQAANSVTVNDGEVTISSQGQQINCEGTIEVAENCVFVK